MRFHLFFRTIPLEIFTKEIVFKEIENLLIQKPGLWIFLEPLWTFLDLIANKPQKTLKSPPINSKTSLWSCNAQNTLQSKALGTSIFCCQEHLCLPVWSTVVKPKCKQSFPQHLKHLKKDYVTLAMTPPPLLLKQIDTISWPWHLPKSVRNLWTFPKKPFNRYIGNHDIEH